MPKKLIDRLFGILIFSLMLLVTGCQEQKKETPQTETGRQLQKDSAVSKEQAKPDSGLAKEQAKPIPDITGTWTGKFDNHSTVLKITEQDSLNFKGFITINYREVINQQVSGKFDPEKKTLTMKDLLHSRYQGTYSAKLSDDLQSFTGTFTMTVDKSKLNFNLKKK
jgi:hypothetical protein